MKELLNNFKVGEKELHVNKTVSYLCGKEINKNDKMRIKVTDHCHYTHK